MEHAHKEERDCKRHEIEKTRVTRVWSYEELRETGEQKENLQRDRTFVKMDIYASRKHLS